MARGQNTKSHNQAVQCDTTATASMQDVKAHGGRNWLSILRRLGVEAQRADDVWM